MQIRFVSSLTPDDERRVAEALVACVAGLLSQFPIAYALRVETSTGDVFDRSDTGGATLQVIDRSRHTH